MKIQFDDFSYIEMNLRGSKVIISMGAKDPKNTLNTVVNSCDITLNELSELINDLKIPLPNIKNTK